MHRFAFTFGLAAFALVAVASSVIYLAPELSGPGFRAKLQQNCARQAKRMFTGQGWRLSGRQPDGRVASYRA